jgi:Tfp pilus assembly protein PilP
MKKELFRYVIYFGVVAALVGCAKPAQEGPSTQKILPLARKVNSAPSPALSPSSAPSPVEMSAPTVPPYNPAGKPDPFMPTTVSIQATTKGKKVLPLEQFEVSDFELVGVVSGSGQTKAMVQDLTGKGYFIQVGTRIGKMGGQVIRITAKEVVVEEPFQDFLGRRSSRVITLKLPQAQYGIP